MNKIESHPFNKELCIPGNQLTTEDLFFGISQKFRRRRHPSEVRKPGSKPTGNKISCKIQGSEVSFPPFYLCGLGISF